MKNTILLFGEDAGLVPGTSPKTKKLRPFTLEVIITILVLLWIYTAGDKLSDYQSYRHSMYLQVFNEKILHILIPSLPFAELVAAGLLMSARHRGYGLWFSALLMALFTGYVALVYFGYFPERPCSCAGLFEKMSWGGHLLMNSALLIIILVGLLLNSKRKEASVTAWR